jgi:hypothetical protein
MSKSTATVVRKVRALKKLRESGRGPKAGQTWTVRTWLEHGLDNIARPSLRESSYNAYRVAVAKHLVPNLAVIALTGLNRSIWNGCTGAWWMQARSLRPRTKSIAPSAWRLGRPVDAGTPPATSPPSLNRHASSPIPSSR